MINLLEQTGHTCGIACWAAREETCRCSCGGVNHGCLKTAGGEQPARSRKIQGQFYELAAVFNGYGEVCDEHMKKDSAVFTGSTVTKNATKAEIEAWPELKSFRGRDAVTAIMKPAVTIWKLSNRYK